MTDYSTAGVCPNCDGTGTADHPLIPVTTCEDCRGTGVDGPTTAAPATPGQPYSDEAFRQTKLALLACNTTLDLSERVADDLLRVLARLPNAFPASGVYQLPGEPPVGSVRWDGEGERLERWPNGWVAPDQLMGPDDLPLAYEDLAHPLSTTPPAGTPEPEVLCGCGAPILRPHRRSEPGCEGAVVPPAGTEAGDDG